MVKIDDHTVRIEYSKPSDNLFWVHFGKAVLAHQKKYSSQFHPEFRDKDELEALVTCSPLQASGGAFLFSQLLPRPDSPLNHLAIRARAQARP